MSSMKSVGRPEPQGVYQVSPQLLGVQGTAQRGTHIRELMMVRGCAGDGPPRHGRGLHTVAAPAGARHRRCCRPQVRPHPVAAVANTTMQLVPAKNLHNIAIEFCWLAWNGGAAAGAGTRRILAAAVPGCTPQHTAASFPAIVHHVRAQQASDRKATYHVGEHLQPRSTERMVTCTARSAAARALHYPTCSGLGCGWSWWSWSLHEAGLRACSAAAFSSLLSPY
jgi:hypothetical protein